MQEYFTKTYPSPVGRRKKNTAARPTNRSPASCLPPPPPPPPPPQTTSHRMSRTYYGALFSFVCFLAHAPSCTDEPFVQEACQVLYIPVFVTVKTKTGTLLTAKEGGHHAFPPGYGLTRLNTSTPYDPSPQIDDRVVLFLGQAVLCIHLRIIAIVYSLAVQSF